MGTPGHNVSESECYAPGKLHHAWQIVLAGHLAYVGAPAGRRTKLRSVEQVEELTSEFKAESAIRAELGVLESGEVEVLLSVGTYVWLSTRIRTIAKVIWVAGGEHRSVVPLAQFRIFGTGCEV